MAELTRRSRKARCVYCGKAKPLTKAGKIRKHYVIAGPTTLVPGQRVACGGSGRQA
jgi:hypothetical protein